MVAFVAVTVAISGSAQDLFHLDFSGTCQSLVNGTLSSRRITQWDLIARCAGVDGLRTNNIGTNQQFDLVYNSSSDSIQVVRLADASTVCDVFQFQGGITNDDGAKKARMAYVFVPEENQTVGTVILREKDRNARNRLSLHGQIQFVLPSLAVGSEGSSTNSKSTLVSAAATSISAVPPPLPGLPGTSVATDTSNQTTTANSNRTIPPELTLPGATTVVATNSTLPSVTTTNTTVITNPALTLPPDLGLALTTATNTSLPNLATTTNGISLSTTNSVTNDLSGLSFTNGVICNATFSASRRIRVTAAP